MDGLVDDDDAIGLKVASARRPQSAHSRQGKRCAFTPSHLDSCCAPAHIDHRADGEVLLNRSEFRWDLTRKIQIAYDQVYDVGERIEISESAGTLFHHLQNSVDTFALCIGEP